MLAEQGALVDSVVAAPGTCRDRRALTGSCAASLPRFQRSTVSDVFSQRKPALRWRWTKKKAAGETPLPILCCASKPLRSLNYNPTKLFFAQFLYGLQLRCQLSELGDHKCPILAACTVSECFLSFPLSLQNLSFIKVMRPN
jgi:hypothetical protein